MWALPTVHSDYRCDALRIIDNELIIKGQLNTDNWLTDN
jgi:hypothetical protein